jgi:hypothetical protein
VQVQVQVQVRVENKTAVARASAKLRCDWFQHEALQHVGATIIPPLHPHFARTAQMRGY